MKNTAIKNDNIIENNDGKGSKRKNISSIINTIKTEHIQPIPRWVCLAKNISFWILLIAMTLLGAMTLSIIVLNTLDIGPDVFRFFGFRRMAFLFFSATPLLWIFFLFFSISFGILAFRKTRHGYRYDILFTGSCFLLIIISFVAGSRLTNMDHSLEFLIEKNTPRGFQGILPPRNHRWSDPQNGFLVGTVQSNNAKTLTIETPNNEPWTVFITEKTNIPRVSCIAIGKHIFIIGKQLQKPRSFEAFFIRHLRIDNKELPNNAQSRKNIPISPGLLETSTNNTTKRTPPSTT